MTKRIIGSLILKSGTVVQSIGFSRYLPVGSPEVAVEFLNQWGVDEIVVLEIESGPDLALLRRLAAKSMVPLMMGGGVDSVETMRAMVAGGADKVCINRAALKNPGLIAEAAAVLGSQCIVVSIDVVPGQEDEAQARAKACAERGAGEILLRAVERDGSKRGYDVALVSKVAAAVRIPVIAAGGCGGAQHIAEAFAAGADAAAVGNMLHYTEHSITTLKAQLKAMGVPVRLDTYATYAQTQFDAEGRLRKQDDAELEKLRFEYHAPETI